MDIFASLTKRFPNTKTERDFSFARHTAIGCGGTAAVAVYPSFKEETAEILTYLIREGIPYCFLGAGANVLPADGFFEGAVICFSKMKQAACGEFLFAGAGMTGKELIDFALKQGVGGFEPFAGIPTTVGGGVAMNAGIPIRHFGDLAVRVEAVENGKIRLFSQKDCLFSEKSSVFLRKIAITGVYFLAEKKPKEAIEHAVEFHRTARKHLPKGRSMGCTFVNPPEISAGKLIELCGLKGLSVGKARVSEQHANFIINEGASASDVAALILKIKEMVFLQTGIHLREEIRRIP